MLRVRDYFYVHPNQRHRSNSESPADPFQQLSPAFWNLGRPAMSQSSTTEKEVNAFIYSLPEKKMVTNGEVALSPHPATAAQQGGSGLNCGDVTSGKTSDLKSRPTRINAKKTMAEISIPGMRAIFGRNAHLARRIIWILILAICFSIAVLQVQDRVAYYLSTPVAVNVRVSRNDTGLRFPVLSLCNKDAFNVTAINILKRQKAALVATAENRNVTQSEMNLWDVADLIGLNGYDSTQVWDLIAHSMDTMTLECWFGRNLTCKSQGVWRKVYTYMGVCYSFQLNDPFVKTTGMFNNLYLKMNDTEEVAYLGDTSGWKMLVHDRLDSPIIDLRTHGTTLYRGWAKDIRVYMREFRTLNTGRRPCIDDDNYSISGCIAQCFTDAAAKVTNCSLPYLNVPQLTPCKNPVDYRNAMFMVDQLLFFGLWSSNNCTCPRQCNQDLYIPYTETTQMEKAYSNLGKLRIFYQDFTYDDIEEELGYSAIPLLCDIGGSLGLLLGASVLTFFEIIEAMSAALVHFTHSIVNMSKDPRLSLRRR